MSDKTNPMHSNDPLHGITLAVLLTTLVERFGWARLAEEININCFKSNPSLKSSLTFLRRTPWARQQVENLYLQWVVKSPWSHDQQQNNQQQNNQQQNKAD